MWFEWFNLELLFIIYKFCGYVGRGGGVIFFKVYRMNGESKLDVGG